MDFKQFEEHWPPFSEGEPFRDKSKYDELHKERSSMPRGRWVWMICLLVAAVGGSLGWSTVAIFGTCGILIAIQAMDILVRILQKTQDLRIEVELLKGSIRENRWQSIDHRERIVNALRGSSNTT